jgi:two-component system, OmpR family, response regulator
MPLTILVADDDPHIRDVLDFALRKNGHSPLLARDGKEALASFQKHAPDLVVLDVGMPELDGLEVCRIIRQRSRVPIIFLSARDEEIDRVLGLEIGGDDYVVKPFSPRELIARIGVIMRRAAGTEPAVDGEAPPVFVHGDLRLDPQGRAATLASRPLGLTGTEFAILRALAEQPGYLFDRERLMAETYGGRVRVSGRTIDSHIRNIRAKCAAAGSSSVVETLHGIGFRLGPCVADMHARPSEPGVEDQG